MDEYSNYPVGIAEILAEKNKDASLWTPRDALILALREIDSGKIAPNKIAILCATQDGNDTKLDKIFAGTTTLELYGLMELAKLDTFEHSLG